MDVESRMMFEIGKAGGVPVYRWWRALEGAGALIPGEWKKCSEVSIENSVRTKNENGFRVVEPTGDWTISVKADG